MIEKHASMSGDMSVTSGYKKTHSWAQLVAGGPPPSQISTPASFLQLSTTTTDKNTGKDMPKPEISQKSDCTITVKLHDPEAQKLY